VGVRLEKKGSYVERGEKTGLGEKRVPNPTQDQKVRKDGRTSHCGITKLREKKRRTKSKGIIKKGKQKTRFFSKTKGGWNEGEGRDKPCGVGEDK